MEVGESSSGIDSKGITDYSISTPKESDADPSKDGQVQGEQLCNEKSKGFTIYSWNINGIRTLKMNDVIKNFNADIVAVQETKISRDQLDAETAFIEDYSSYFTFCRNKTGFAGVATYAAKGFTPIKAEEGLSELLQIQMNKQLPDAVGNYVMLEEETEENVSLLRYIDSDGRCVITQHLVQKPDGEQVPLTIFNVYCPRLRCESGETNNAKLKEIFHQHLYQRAIKLIDSGSFVLMIGDFNISHTSLDHVEGDNRPHFSDMRAFREHFDLVVGKGQNQNSKWTFHDTFRIFNPTRKNAFTVWNTKTNARENNYGSRLDYILADNELVKYLSSAEIYPEILGSDHCPISATFQNLIPVILPSNKLPTFATKNYPELSGTQKKIQDFFSKSNIKDLPSQQEKNKPVFSRKTKAKQLSLTSFLVKKPKVSDSLNNEGKPDDETEAQSLLLLSNSSGGSDDCHAIEFEQFEETTTKEKTVMKNTSSSSKNLWKELMKPPSVPNCRHDEPCILRTVRKKGPTQGRQFWACARGTGQSSDPNANCNHFQWFTATTTTVSNTTTNKQQSNGK